MLQSEYVKIITTGTKYDVVAAVREEFEIRFRFFDYKRRVRARLATKPYDKPQNKPKFFFGPAFLTMLSYMPSVDMRVGESRSQIRKTCYGFRSSYCKERIYIRVDPGSLIMFRDSPAGFMTCTRYLIPGLDRIKPFKWYKLVSKMRQLLKRDGIIVKGQAMRKYKWTLQHRIVYAKRLDKLCLAALTEQYTKKSKNEKADK